MTEQITLKDPKDPKDLLYRRAYQLSHELITLKKDLAELKGEFAYHKEFNKGGLDKGVVATTIKAAKAAAQAEELDEIKAEAKQYLTEIGYALWHKHLIKCLRTLPMRKCRKEIIRYANEIANRDSMKKVYRSDLNV